MKSRFLLVALVALLLTACGSSGASPPDIVFVSSRDGAYQLYAMSADGKHQRRLTQEKGDPSSPRGLFFQIEPAWSPDGRLIAFSSRRDGPSHIFVMRADGAGIRRLTDTKGNDANPTWSPSGSRIAFDRNGHLFVMNADGTGARRVGRDPATQTDPAWSPDGHWLAYVRKAVGTTVREIWLAHPDGSGDRKLAGLGTVSESPAWSPDSRRIAFASNAGSTVSDIYEVGLNGKRPRRLTVSDGAFEPDWSPKGNNVVFWSNGAILVTHVGDGQEPLTNGKGNDSSPVWRPVQPASGSG